MFLHVHPPTPNVNMCVRVPTLDEHVDVFALGVRECTRGHIRVACPRVVWGHCMRMRVRAGGTRTRIGGGGGTRTDGGGGTQADGGGGTQADGGGGTQAGRRSTGHPSDYCAVSVNKRNKS